MGLLRGQQAACYDTLGRCLHDIEAPDSKVKKGGVLSGAELACLRPICARMVETIITSVVFFSDTQTSVNATITSILVHRLPYVQRSLEIEAMGRIGSVEVITAGAGKPPPVPQAASDASAAAPSASAGSLGGLSLSELLSQNGLSRMLYTGPFLLHDAIVWECLLLSNCFSATFPYPPSFLSNITRSCERAAPITVPRILRGSFASVGPLHWPHHCILSFNGKGHLSSRKSAQQHNSCARTVGVLLQIGLEAL